MRKNVKQMILIAGLIVLMMMLGLLWSVNALAAPFLVCDPQAGVISYNLDVNGTIIEGIPAAIGGSIYWDLAGMSFGPHTFKAQAIGEGGWPSDWSDPFDTTKPENPLNLRVSGE